MLNFLFNTCNRLRNSIILCNFADDSVKERLIFMNQLKQKMNIIWMTDDN